MERLLLLQPGYVPQSEKEGNRQWRVVSGLVSFTITVINDPLEARRRRTLSYVPDTGPLPNTRASSI